MGIDGFVYPNGFEADGDSYVALYDDQIVTEEITVQKIEPNEKRFSLTDAAREAEIARLKV